MLVELGALINQNELLPYDSIGLSSDHRTLAVGFQQNTNASILISIGSDDNSFAFSFNDEVRAYEALVFFMEVIEKIPATCDILPNFKIQ